MTGNGIVDAAYSEGGTKDITTPSAADLSEEMAKDQEKTTTTFKQQIVVSEESEDVKKLDTSDADDELLEVTKSLNDVKLLLEISKLEAETEAKAIAADVAIQKAKLALLEVYALEEEEDAKSDNNSNDKDLQNNTQNITESIAHTILIAEKQTVSESAEGGRADSINATSLQQDWKDPHGAPPAP